MATSSVPKITFTSTGIILPAETDILAAVQADMNSAFGGGLNPALETPQGQLASSQTAIIGDKNNEFAFVVNQVDPQFAEGRFQDAIGRIYFLNRHPATSTAVTCTLIGVVGTVIPLGTLAKDTSGNIYAITAAATISATGSVDAVFQNVKTGPIPCPPATLTQVYQAVVGWDAITNAAAGVLGADVESRADFEFRRKNSVAINAVGTVGAIYGSVFDVPNVLDVYVLDNPTGATVTKGATNFPLVAHSVYVAVVGGVDADVAKAIWTKKDVGCNYNGNTTVQVFDTAGYAYPQPVYDVKFQRPAAQPIKFAVSVVNDPLLPANAIPLIKAAITARFNGSDGSARERIGSNVFASRYYTPVATATANISVISIMIGISSPTLTNVPIGIDQYPTVTDADIVVTLV